MIIQTGLDFVGNNEVLTFGPGDSSGSTLIFINNDNLYEGTEDFTVILTTTDSAVEIFQPVADITITDDGLFFSSVCKNSVPQFFFLLKHRCESLLRK